MRFTHSADCHLGSYRDPRLRQLCDQAFERFVTITLEQKADFCIIAGDLFNTAIPGIDTLKYAVIQLGRLRQQDIPVYAIPGSHDFSPSGKTMLDVLEEAGLLRNVCRGAIGENGRLRLSFTVDPKTGVKLTGVIGRRGMLDRQIYESLDPSIGDEPGPKIFLFHTAISELKPDALREMESAPVSFLPPGFDYYAGGHVHIVERYSDAKHRNVVYPGPLFPNNFLELEQLGNGGFFLYDDGEMRRQEVALRPVRPLLVDVDGKSAQEARQELLSITQTADVHDAIALLRVRGALTSGSASELGLRDAVQALEARGAYIVLRNTFALSSPEFSAVRIMHEDSPHDIEQRMLQEHKTALAAEALDGVLLAQQLLRVLSREQNDGERVHEYEGRVQKEALGVIDGMRERP